MNLEQFTQKLPKPSVILITGRRGSGKDATACALAAELHRQTGKPVFSPYDPARFKQLPKYWNLRAGNEYKPETIQLISDAHLQYFSREWQADLSIALVKLISITRHQDTDIIYTTQVSSLLDKQAVSNIDALVMKEPSALADKFERPELKELTFEARTFFQGKSQSEKWRSAYIFTHIGTFEVTGIDKPAWFTEDISKIFGQQPTEETPFWKRIF